MDFFQRKPFSEGRFQRTLDSPGNFGFFEAEISPTARSPGRPRPFEGRPTCPT